MDFEKVKIGVIGLGYVGLPLAVEFGKLFPVVGYDINSKRIELLNSGHDTTGEVSTQSIELASHLVFSESKDDLADCNIYIVSVPTPIDAFKRPDISLLIDASEKLGELIKPGDIVVYESTVYPGATEEDCVPILSAKSGLKYNEDFFVGYSPERINPGDKKHDLTSVMKVTSGSTEQTADFIDKLYVKIITAGTHKARSIKVAEAAKVIENIQRDVNIALINELSLIFGSMNIDTMDVLAAAETKWNFLPFKPGLVGGHCIGIDPYYLTHKAQEYGYHPEVILAGRKINDSIGKHVAERVIKLLLAKEYNISESKILVLGFTFKENCPDIRNTKVIDVIEELNSFSASVDVYDPWVDAEEVFGEYGIECLANLPVDDLYDAIILTVNHEQFMQLGADGIAALGRSEAVIYDVKSILPYGSADERL